MTTTTARTLSLTPSEGWIDDRPVLLAGFYNPKTAKGGIGTVMSMTASGLPRLNIVYAQQSPTENGSDLENVFPLRMSRQLIDSYQRKLCKLTLWPVLHDSPPFTEALDAETLTDVDSFIDMYARHIMEVASALPEETVIWFNDYSMIPVIKRTRELLGNARQIGLSIRCCFGAVSPPRFGKEYHALIVDSVLSADFISFHRVRDVYNFLDFIREAAPQTSIDWETRAITSVHGQVTLSCIPMGSSPEYWAQAGASAVAKKHLTDLKSRLKAESLILSVSRLEPHKGIDLELDSVERLLTYFPTLQGTFRFIRITPVFSEYTHFPQYEELLNRLKRRTSEINLKFGTPFWRPIELVTGPSLPHEELAAYYRAAQVVMVLSPADGFNHISAESILAKQHGDKPLTLMLSDTGSSDYLQGGFISAHALAPAEIALKLKGALSLPQAEREELHRVLLQRTSRRTALDWTSDVIKSIHSCARREGSGTEPLNSYSNDIGTMGELSACAVF
jgi:trehalose-6-phosphate synthase